MKVDKFVGVVSEGSKIGKLKFEYSKWQGDLEEGDLLEITINNKVLYYQVVEAVTAINPLEAKNEFDCVFGYAIQLGE